MQLLAIKTLVIGNCGCPVVINVCGPASKLYLLYTLKWRMQHISFICSMGIVIAMSRLCMHNSLNGGTLVFGDLSIKCDAIMRGYLVVGLVSLSL